jgi:Tfp pilus assembly protein PilE
VKSHGFTVVELMTILLMMGVITAIAIPRHTTLRVQAIEAAVQMNMHTLQIAAEDFATMAEGRYPEYINYRVDVILAAIGIQASNNHVVSDCSPQATGMTVNDGNDIPTIALLPGNNAFKNPFHTEAASLDNQGTEVTVEAALANPPCHSDNPPPGSSGEGTVFWTPVGTVGCDAMIGYVIFGDGDKNILYLRLTSDE